MGRRMMTKKWLSYKNGFWILLALNVVVVSMIAFFIIKVTSEPAETSNKNEPAPSSDARLTSFTIDLTQEQLVEFLNHLIDPSQNLSFSTIDTNVVLETEVQYLGLSSVIQIEAYPSSVDDGNMSFLIEYVRIGSIEVPKDFFFQMIGNQLPEWLSYNRGEQRLVTDFSLLEIPVLAGISATNIDPKDNRYEFEMNISWEQLLDYLESGNEIE